ncbi:hypothetical protein PG988_001789 [Apiospora saccharicola]
MDLDEDDNEAELIKTARAYVTENRPTALNDFAGIKRSWPAPAVKEPASTERMPPGWTRTLWFFWEVTGERWTHDYHDVTSLRGLKFEPFRRLGFAIWDERRMAAAAFLSESTEDANRSSHLMAWKSVLGRKVLDEVAAELFIEKEHQHPSEDSDSETSYVGDERVLPRWARACGYVSHVPSAHPLPRRKHRQPTKAPLS